MRISDLAKLALRLSCICLGLALSAGSTPPGRWGFHSYGSDQGLTNLSMWSLEQDQDGFLWVGTESGLFRYDGNRFKRYSVKEGLPADMVRVVFASRTRSLWLGTLQGVAVRTGSRIQALGPDSGLNTSEIFSFAEEEGRVWVGADHGLFRQVPGKLAFQALPGWPAEATARALCLDGKTMYVGSGPRLFAYDLPGCERPREIPGPWKERVDSLAKDGLGRLWIRTRGELWMRPPGGGAFQDMNGHLSGTAFFDGALRVDPEGSLLIPMAEGLVRVKGETWDFIGEAQGLPTPWVNRAIVDREGSLWVCGTGLHRGLGREVWHMHTQRDGIPGSVVQSLFQDRQGRFYIGTAMGACLAGPKGWTVVPGTKGTAVLAMLQDPDGSIWMAGSAPWILRWDPVRNTWITFKDLGSTVTHMAQEASGDILAATRRKGLWRVFRQGQAFAIEQVALPGGAKDERIQGVANGCQGRIWAAGSLGLACKENGRWTRYTQADGLESLHVLAMIERANGDLWLSYLSTPGAFRYRRENGRLVRKEALGTQNGLSSDQIHFFREDTLGRLWLGTSLGADMIDGSTIHCFGTGEGLPGDDCNANAFFSEPGGNVWVGTLGGLGSFNAAAYRGLPAPPSSLILSAQFGDRVLTGPQAQVPSVPHRDANPEFRFAGLSFLNESKVAHQIRLLGYERDWHATDIRQATFTNLAPGTYRFEVRAAFGSGAWGPPAHFDFKVIPAWWQTLWFRILAFLGVAGVLFALVRARVKALQRKNLLLDQLVTARTRELADANNTLRQLTVTDPLTGLKNRRYLDLTIEEDLAKVRRDYMSISRQQQHRMAVNIDMLFLMVDLDHFKQVNDTYGHSVGDSVLQQLKDRLLSAVRDTDTVVRWGGEEFLLVAKGTDRSQAGILSERILGMVRDVPFDVGNGHQITKTCSLGFAPYPCMEEKADAISWQKVVDLADRCLYAAKKSGRNAWVGVQDCTAEPEALEHFLENPPAMIQEGHWQVITSCPDLDHLEW